MGKCDLAVQLDEPDRIYQGGDKVRGVVTVSVESKVKSKKLTIKAGWATHGKGNVDGSISETATEFPEEWLPGKEYRYPFELTAASWPPTYHGSYLSVEHYIKAQAHLAWRFDPKATAPFQIFAADGPDAMEKPTKAGCGLGTVVVGFIAFVMVVMFLINPFFWFFGAIIGFFAGAYWFIWRFLPRRMLGEVSFELSNENSKYVPGEILEGTLMLTPNSKVPINQIVFSVSGSERCVSGSGTNKKTYTKIVFEDSVTVMQEGELKAAQQLRIPLQLQLPAKPIFSLELGSNSLNWTCKVHIDIRRWPDWKRSKAFVVYPPRISDGDASVTDKVSPPAKKGVPVASDFDQSSDVSFGESVAMIQASLGNNDTVDELVNAVSGLPMKIHALIEGRVVYEGNDPNGHPGGYSVLARSHETNLPMQMFIRADQRDHFSQLSNMAWEGSGQIVGYSHHLDRLLVKVD